MSGRYSDSKLPPTTMFGIEHSEADMVSVRKTAVVGDYSFTVLPVNRYHSRDAEQRFVKFAGSMTPVFEPERFDMTRERLQTMPKPEQEKIYRTFVILYTEGLAAAFLKDEDKLDLAKFEALLYPKCVMTYADTLKAVGMTRKPWWFPIPASHLENWARFPLDRCSHNLAGRRCTLSFAEFYSLFWNYYHPFNAMAYLCMITRQTTVVTTEFLDAFIDLLLYRYSLLDKEGKAAPILFLGGKIGKIGGLLNATKRLPVAVIHTHESPNINPYLMFIPPEKQNEFRPHPIIKMKNVDALQKYEPRIVLMTDMDANQDDTALVRKQGSVREYYYLGLPGSYIEGTPHSWGKRTENNGFVNNVKEGMKGGGPELAQQGWAPVSLPYLSRWLLHRHDSQPLKGCGQVTGFYRKACLPTAREIWGYRFARFKPFF